MCFVSTGHMRFPFVGRVVNESPCRVWVVKKQPPAGRSESCRKFWRFFVILVKLQEQQLGMPGRKESSSHVQHARPCLGCHYPAHVRGDLWPWEPGAALKALNGQLHPWVFQTPYRQLGLWVFKKTKLLALMVEQARCIT